MKILIVDDSKAMRMIVMRTLRQAGYGGHELMEAGDGAAALEHIKRDPPDVVMCDWNMPEVSGIEVLQSLADQGSAVRFGFVTSEVIDDMRQTAIGLGAKFFITKPFTAEAFETALGPLLG
jgi:two-component system chemotaxis response regulator CheY